MVCMIACIVVTMFMFVLLLDCALWFLAGCLLWGCYMLCCRYFI